MTVSVPTEINCFFDGQVVELRKAAGDDLGRIGGSQTFEPPEPTSKNQGEKTAVCGSSAALPMLQSFIHLPLAADKVATHAGVSEKSKFLSVGVISQITPGMNQRMDRDRLFRFIAEQSVFVELRFPSLTRWLKFLVSVPGYRQVQALALIS